MHCALLACLSLSVSMSYGEEKHRGFSRDFEKSAQAHFDPLMIQSRLRFH